MAGADKINLWLDRIVCEFAFIFTNAETLYQRKVQKSSVFFNNNYCLVNLILSEASGTERDSKFIFLSRLNS